MAIYLGHADQIKTEEEKAAPLALWLTKESGSHFAFSHDRHRVILIIAAPEELPRCIGTRTCVGEKEAPQVYSDNENCRALRQRDTDLSDKSCK